MTVQVVEVIREGRQTVEIEVPGKSGPRGPRGPAGVLLLEQGENPPDDTPVGTIIYRKA